MDEVSSETRAAMLRRLGEEQKDFEETYRKAMKRVERERPEHVDDVLLPYAIGKYCNIVSNWEDEEDGALPDAIDVIDRVLKGHRWMTDNVSVSGKIPASGIQAMAALLVELRLQQHEIEQAEREDRGEHE